MFSRSIRATVRGLSRSDNCCSPVRLVPTSGAMAWSVLPRLPGFRVAPLDQLNREFQVLLSPSVIQVVSGEAAAVASESAQIGRGDIFGGPSHRSGPAAL